jgi:hypothetical protein
VDALSVHSGEFLMPNTNRLPDEVISLMENFVREVTKRNCAVMGMVFCTEPVIGMGMMRNTTGDPVMLMQKLTKIVEEAQEDGRIEDVHILPLN